MVIPLSSIVSELSPLTYRLGIQAPEAARVQL